MLARCLSTLFLPRTCSIRSFSSTSAPGSLLDDRLLDRIHGQSQHLLTRVVKDQVNAGYKPDHWRMVRLGELPHPNLLQSLTYGARSICQLSSLELESFERFLLPQGSSTYFATMCAFSKHGRIHSQSPGKTGDDHYAAATQTRAHSIFGYREHLGIFSLKDLLSLHNQLSDVMVAIADIKANPEYGHSESRQIVVPVLLLPLIHTCCRRIINQSNYYGISKVQSSINPRTGVIEWSFEDRAASSEGVENRSVYFIPPRRKW